MERVFRVLLVDDEACVTDELSLLLGARTDLDLYTSSSALNALAVLKRTRIDLMISDIRISSYLRFRFLLSLILSPRILMDFFKESNSLLYFPVSSEMSRSAR